MNYLTVTVILTSLTKSASYREASTRTDFGDTGSVKITSDNPMYYSNADGTISDTIFQFQNDLVRLFTKIDHLDTKNATCRVILKYYNNQNFTAVYAPRSQKPKRVVQYGDICYNNRFSVNSNHDLYVKRIVDPTLDTCLELEKYDVTGIDNIKQLLARTDSKILSEIRDDIASKGVSVLLYKYPFRSYSPETILAMKSKDIQDQIGVINKINSSVSQSTIECEPVNLTDEKELVNDFHYWKNRLAAFCRQREQAESRPQL